MTRTRRTRMPFRSAAAAALAALSAVALTALDLASAARAAPASQPARPAAPVDPKRAEREKWENVITFFGEEDTGNYSIRILDRTVPEPATFHYLALWKYDLKEKTWLKIDDREQTTKIVRPQDKPSDAPEGSQLLAHIPVTQETLGLYYCKWQVNETDGATLTRIGPGPAGKIAPLGPTPAGMIVSDVPLDKTHGARMFVPDPTTHTAK